MRPWQPARSAVIGKQRPQIATGPAKPKRPVRLGRGFWVLCGGAFINRAGTMVVPFMTLYLVGTRGFSIVVAGEMLAGFGGGAVVAPLIGGALADRVGRRPRYFGGTLTTAAIMVALPYARLTALLVVLIVLLGVTLEAPRPVTQALVADLVPEEDRARAYAALFWVSNLRIRGGDDERRLPGPIRVHRDLLDRRGHRFVVRRSRVVVRARTSGPT